MRDPTIKLPTLHSGKPPALRKWLCCSPCPPCDDESQRDASRARFSSSILRPRTKYTSLSCVKSSINWWVREVSIQDCVNWRGWTCSFQQGQIVAMGL